MALAITHIGALEDSVDRTSYSITHTAITSGRLYLLFFQNTKASTPDVESSITTTGITWLKPTTNTVLSHEIAAPLTRLTVAYGIASSSGATTTTVAFGATQTGFSGAVEEVTGFNSSAVLANDATTNVVDNVNASAVGMSISKTITNSLNMMVASFVMDANATFTPGGSFVELYDNGHGTPAAALQVQALVNGSNPSMTGPASTRDLAGIALEINETSVGGGGGGGAFPHLYYAAQRNS